MGAGADIKALVVCETPELAVACLQAGDAIGLPLATRVDKRWLGAFREVDPRQPRAVALQTPPTFAQLVELATLSHPQHATPVVGLVGGGPAHSAVFDAAGDLGIPVVGELGPLVAALALLAGGARAPFAVGTRGLSSLDRVRVGDLVGRVGEAGGELASGDHGQLAWAAGGADPVEVGSAPDVGLALRSLQGMEHAPEHVTSSVDDVDGGTVGEILFGPRRALSDPASKAALAPYGIPMPVEELCASASRAASEASRIGYPVRIALASPDLRVWDHPELAVDMVDNAARVRDTYRQLMALASRRMVGGPAAQQQNRGEVRLLGVSVAATSVPIALLGVHATPLPEGHVATRLYFCDPHGAASNDSTSLVLPAPMTRIERAIARLEGSALIRDTTASQRRERIDSIADVLLRLAAFMGDRGAEVESVELRPLALRLDGSVEVREACVAVSDSFERSLG